MGVNGLRHQIAPYWLQLEFYTQFRVLSGYIHCPVERRLLDLLNDAGASDYDINGEFLEFIDISASSEDQAYQQGLKEYIRKAAIQLVGISDTNLARGVGTKAGSKLYPFIQKSTFPVSLQLQTYTLTGSIHYSQGQSVQDVLNEQKLFIPLTDVTIAHQYGMYATRPFVAVNKEQVISSREEEPATSTANLGI
jgi:hypothetical protein